MAYYRSGGVEHRHQPEGQDMKEKEANLRNIVAAINAPPDLKKMMSLPGRKARRGAKKHQGRGSINPYARPIKKGPLPPASLKTLVAVHVHNEDGKVIRKFVVPRENVDPAMLAKD